jgi:4-aminobutyrate aminotransferase-like enzyme
MGEYLNRSLTELSEEFKLIGEVRGKGLLIGVELVKDRITKEPAEDEGTRLVDLCMDKGLIIGIVRGMGMSSVLRIAPPLVVTIEEIDKAVEIIRSSLRQL